jgi:hypothetical protein
VLTVIDLWSGIKRYKAMTKDKVWILMRYDQKNNLLYWDTTKTNALKVDELFIELEDLAGNKTVIPISIK